jgi:hypothetical protein
MTTDGWHAARAAGLGTVVDLRNNVEAGRGQEHPVIDERACRGLEVVSAPTEDPDDPDFLAECGPWLDHPRSWAPNMARYPEKFAVVFSAIADARGGVLVHCAGGRDRTGMVCSVLLLLAGAEVSAIVDNYESGFRGAAGHRGHGLGYDLTTGEWRTMPDQDWSVAELDAALADRRPVVEEWARDTDPAAYLTAAGLDDRRVSRLRELLRPGSRGFAPAGSSE